MVNRRSGGGFPRRHARLLGALIGTALLLAAGLLVDRLRGPVQGDAVEGAAEIIDGDSLMVGAREVRIFGIDAPEARQTCERDGADWPCGRMATQHMREMLRGQGVSCRGVETDRYGRLVARCKASGQDVGAAMVSAGFALAYGDYQREEDQARAARLGLWAGTFQRPRDWRNERREDNQ
jgi:endonuclease YncB( thermonuclease family)